MPETLEQYKPVVLLVEDDRTTLSQLEQLLKRKPITVHCAADGEEGLRLYLEKRPDIVITDIMMLPAMNGFEMVRRIRLINPEVMMIVITAYSDSTFLIEAIGMGINHYVLKPVEIGKLYATVDSCRETVLARRKLKEQETALLNAGREWSDTFDAMADGISIHACDFTILNANKALCDILGSSTNELIGRKCHQAFHGCDHHVQNCPLEKSKTSGDKEYMEFFEPSLNKWLSTSTAPVKDEYGTTVKIIHAVRDISERRTIEEQLLQAKKMESIGALAGGVAHDFNNNLTIIMSYCSMLQSTIKQPDQMLDFYLEQIMSASKRSMSLTRSLLEFSRKRAINQKQCNLNQILHNLQPLITGTLGADITLEWRMGETPLPVCIDSNQIEQVLINLITNARDAMPQGGVLTIATSTMDNAHSLPAHSTVATWAVMSVSDTGIGMDTDTRQRIFDPFFTTKSIGKGTGLGMANAYSFIKQNGGFIEVQSELGKGSTFLLLFPLIQEAVQNLEREVHKTDLEQGHGTILVVDDEAALRIAVDFSLSKQGYEVVHAANGEEAVARFMEIGDKLSLILMDITMPVMNGWEAARLIGELRPGMKIIFTSGNDLEVQHGSDLQNIDVIAKPYDPGSLLRKIQEVLTAEHLCNLKTPLHKAIAE